MVEDRVGVREGVVDWVEEVLTVTVPLNVPETVLHTDTETLLD